MTIELVYQLGPLSVFKQLKDTTDILQPEGYYWRCELLRRSYGHFQTVHECTLHYEQTLMAERKDAIAKMHVNVSPNLLPFVEDPGNSVIYVDFINKKRHKVRIK